MLEGDGAAAPQVHCQFRGWGRGDDATMRLSDEQIQNCIGWVARYTAPEAVGAAAIRYFALAVNDCNPVYVDAEAARRAGHRSVIAPPTFVCETNQFMDGAADANGYMGHTWDLDVVGCRWVRGGNAYEFGRPVSAEDVITVVWRLALAENKISRVGEEMLMIVSEANYTDQQGEFLAYNRETMFYF